MFDEASPNDDFLAPALERLAGGAGLAEFCDWFAERHADLFLAGARARGSSPEQAPAEARRAALALARTLWRATPDPAQGWRTRQLPVPGRNDPCYCGSGRKHKQCCQSLASELPPLDLDPATMAGMLFIHGPADWRRPQALRGMPPEMLAASAHACGTEEGAAAVLGLLEPLYLAPAGLGGRHDAAFDLLMDAMLEQGLDARREQVARAVAERATHRRLRSAGRCRLASMLCDRGCNAEAWDEFRAAQREDPDNPELLHLEMTMLLAEGRDDQARARAPVLAARARKLGHQGLAEVLLRLPDEGLAAVRGTLDEHLDEKEQAWLALLREPLPRLDPKRFRELHTIAQGGGEISVIPEPRLERPLAVWRRRFGAAPGMLTLLDGRADALLEDAVAAREWLQGHADCALTVAVLDDLLIAARAMLSASAALPLWRAACELAYGAADMLVAALADRPGLLPWAEKDNRPPLRLMSQAIALALDANEEERAFGWMRWMLERNPNDNHGWREPLRIALLRVGDAESVLSLLDTFPEDMAPSQHDRALALYLLQRRAEAEAVLRRAHAKHPAFVAALLPEALDRPAGAETGMAQPGGAAAAWDWRTAVRDLWRSSGALDWVRGLELPPEPPRTSRPQQPSRREARVSARAPGRMAPPPSAGDPLPLLRSQFGDRLPWLLGWLAGAAWSPAVTMPTVWLDEVFRHAGAPADMDAAQAMLTALMDQYNAFNAQRLAAARGRKRLVPLPTMAIAPQDDAGWAGFAAGFVQFAETHAAAAWRAAGASLEGEKNPMAALRRIAALAPAGPGGWRALDDQGRPLLDPAPATEPVFERLRRAMQPVWALAAAGG